MKSDKLTIYDIAKLAGVSTTTVSRVINNNGYVSKEKRELVLQVIEEKKYKPNAVAQSLSTSMSRTIGMLVPDVRNAFYSTLFSTLEKEALKYDYNVILCNYSNNNEITTKQCDMLLKKQVDVILQVGGPSDLYEIPQEQLDIYAEINKRVPVVTTGKLQGSDFYSVGIDDSYAIDAALRDMYAKGHRKYVIAGGSSRYIPTRSKQEQFTKTLTELGIPEKDRIVFDYDNFDQYGGIKSIEILLENEPVPPTVFMGINEAFAIGMENELIRRGFKIPQDASVIGFDNTYLSDFVIPELSCIGCDYEEYAEALMKTILGIASGKCPLGTGSRGHFFESYVQSRFVVRKSTGVLEK